MVGMGSHGRDNGGDAAGSRDGDCVCIIRCEVRVRVGAGLGKGQPAFPEDQPGVQATPGLGL